MPASTVRAFTDPDAYHATIRNAEVSGVITGRGNYRTELTHIDLCRLWMQRADENLPRVLNVETSGTRPGIFFATDENQASQYVGGTELGRGEIVVGLACTDHIRSSAACRWGAMSLTAEDLAAAGRAIIGRELTVPAATSRVTPPPAVLARLLSLHETACKLAQTAPDILQNSETARAMEQSLVHAMVTCLSSGEAVATGNLERRRALVMQRLEEVLQANSDRSLYIDELCAAAGVSYPTLRAFCWESLGMSPKRYLLLRRMHLARCALRQADPKTTTVTEIATNYGFWELGRFSVAYRSQFGETPKKHCGGRPRIREPIKTPDRSGNLSILHSRPGGGPLLLAPRFSRRSIQFSVRCVVRD